VLWRREREPLAERLRRPNGIRFIVRYPPTSEAGPAKANVGLDSPGRELRNSSTVRVGFGFESYAADWDRWFAARYAQEPSKHLRRLVNQLGGTADPLAMQLCERHDGRGRHTCAHL
jgi:hypothetical protein